MRALWISIFLGLWLLGCTEKLGYVQPPKKEALAPQDGIGEREKILRVQHTITEILKHYSVAVPADILWVIDNSGSMAAHQAAVAANTAAFMDRFTQLPNLDWKMGLLSSDVADEPYAGFSNTGEVSSHTPNASTLFSAAVGQLGTGGSSVEKFYDPIKKALTNYPAFLRSSANVNVILVTDTDDQSSETPSEFKAYLDSLLGKKPLKWFGVYNQGDTWNCPKTDNLEWLWATSRHLALMLLGVSTRSYQLCSTDFGTKLLDLADGLVLQSAKAEIQLTEAIVPETLVIVYQDKQLKAGSEYTYNASQNLIEFPNLDFASDLNATVRIYYEVP